MAFRAVLFVLDGTRLDTLEDLAESADAVLAFLGAPGHPREAYRRFVGDGVANLMARALPEGRRDEATVARAVDRMREEYGRRFMAKTHPYPGVPEMLSALAARGVPYAVLSNKQDEFTRGSCPGSRSPRSAGSGPARR
jgi:phosphoglycolate phosphatase